MNGSCLQAELRDVWIAIATAGFLFVVRTRMPATMYTVSVRGKIYMVHTFGVIEGSEKHNQHNRSCLKQPLAENLVSIVHLGASGGRKPIISECTVLYVVNNQ